MWVAFIHCLAVHQPRRHLHLGEEVKQEDEEAIIESTASWWGQPDLLERGRKNAGPTHATPCQAERALPQLGAVWTALLDSGVWVPNCSFNDYL